MTSAPRRTPLSTRKTFSAKAEEVQRRLRLGIAGQGAHGFMDYKKRNVVVILKKLGIYY